MEDICTGCLCSGRKLSSIVDTAYCDFYSQILNEIPVQIMSQVSIRICWECAAMLQKFALFKEQVKRCYTELLWNIPSPNPSHFTSSEVYNISYPDVADAVIQEAVKEECALRDVDIKSEAEECTEHQEPETFVNDLKVEGKHDEPVKKSKKKPKEKKASKNKIKVKKKRSKTKEVVQEPVADDISDTDLPLEDAFQEDADDRIEESKKEDVPSMLDVENEIKKMDTEPVKVVKPNGPLPVRVVKVPAELLPEKPQCVECGKLFSSRKTYRYHMNVLHKGNNRYPCPRCGKVYQWKSNLGRHMRTHKAVDAGELYCDPCDKSFASVATYRQHLRISRRHVSENEFGFTCNECGKKFVNKTRLRDHIDWDHLKKIKFRCQQCNKPFKCHTSLYVHLQNVHRNKEKKDNLCHVCGKSYQNAAKLKYHIVALHTGETPYQCAQCAAAFGWYSSLYRHIREVHYKVKSQPKKAKKSKKLENEPTGYNMNFHP